MRNNPMKFIDFFRTVPDGGGSGRRLLRDWHNLWKCGKKTEKVSREFR
jgi:hypothetical protein